MIYLIAFLFEPNGIDLAENTIINFITKDLRPYEQEPPHTRARRFEEYTIMPWLSLNKLDICIYICIY